MAEIKGSQYIQKNFLVKLSLILCFTTPPFKRSYFLKQRKHKVTLARATKSLCSSCNHLKPKPSKAVTNEFNGVTYRYLRVTHVLGGTTPSINYIANLVPQAH